MPRDTALLVLVFNNVPPTTTCGIIGYPGVDLLTAAGGTVAHLERRAPGRDRHTECGNDNVLITVPNQHVAVGGGTVMLPRCEAEIHPAWWPGPGHPAWPA